MCVSSALGDDDAEADVVPCPGIFRPDVAKTDNKIFVAHKADLFTDVRTL